MQEEGKQENKRQEHEPKPVGRSTVLRHDFCLTVSSSFLQLPSAGCGGCTCPSGRLLFGWDWRLHRLAWRWGLLRHAWARRWSWLLRAARSSDPDTQAGCVRARLHARDRRGSKIRKNRFFSLLVLRIWTAVLVVVPISTNKRVDLGKNLSGCLILSGSLNK